MKILSPINKVDEIEKVIKAGASEIYTGVLSKNWLRTYSHAGTINGSPSRFNNLRNYDELRKITDIAHSYNVPVFFTLNSYYYSKNQYTILIDEVSKAIKCNVDAFIIADIGILDTINKMDNGIEIHLSVVGGAFNSKTLDFYSKRGVSRVVLPKQLTIREVKTISKKNKKMELECFIFTSGCPNAEAFCRFQHGVIEAKHPILSKFIFDNPFQSDLIKRLSRKRFKKINNFIQNHTFLADRAACSLQYDFLSDLKKEGEFSNKIKDNISSNLSNLYDHKMLNGCGACSLLELKEIGIHSLKTEDKCFPLKDRIKKIIFLNEIFRHSRKSINKQDFHNYVIEKHSELLGFRCNKNYCNCLVD